MVEIPGLRLEQEIGRGARGIVYRARRGEQTVAVKIPNRADDQGFRREGAILGCIRHRGLAEVMEVDEVDDTPYLVREYLDGDTLAGELEGGPLSVERIAQIGIPLAEALAQVHRLGLVHRDVKPYNIIVLRNGDAKLIDFGLATHMRSEADEAVGTFHYCAPEQSGMLKRPLDGRADLYALGAVLYQCASGRPPFQADSLGDLLRQHAVVPAPDLRALRADFSPALAAIIARLLAKDPDDRYQTGEGLAADLRALGALDAALRRGEPCRLAAGEEGSQTRFEPPLTGREASLAQLEHLYGEVVRGEGRAVLLTGASGVGKSRFIREFLRRRSKSSIQLRGRCSLEDASPFQPLREALDRGLVMFERLPASQREYAERTARQSAAGFASILSSFTPRASRLFGETHDEEITGGADQFYEALSAWLLKLAESFEGAVLVLDDVQWIDDATLQVVRALARQLSEANVLLLCCARSDHELNEVREALGEGRRELSLSGLDEGSVKELLSAHLGGRPVGSDLGRQIFQRSRGNPLAVAEYVRTLLEEGLLRLTAGGWSLRAGGLQRLRPSEDMVQLILQRLAALDPRRLQVLRHAALLGTRFRLDLLQRVVPDDPEAAVEDALRLNLVDRLTGSEYVFLHDQLRMALLADVSLEETRAMHQRIAEALDSAGGDVFPTALHYILGETDRAPERLIATCQQAGARALHDFAHEEAYRFLSEAERVAMESDRLPGADFYQLLGEACYHTDRLPEADSNFRWALESTTDPIVRAGLWARLAEVSMGRQERSGARREIDRAIAELAGDALAPGLPQMLSVLRSAPRVLFHELFRGRGKAREDQRSLPRTLARLCEASMMVCYRQGRYVEMMHLGFRGYLHAAKLGPSPELCNFYCYLTMMFAFLRMPAGVRLYHRRSEELARRLSDPVALARAHLFQALSSSFVGHALQAEAILDEHFERDSRWLVTQDFLHGCIDQTFNLMLRGYASGALQWVERGLQRVSPSAEASVGRDVAALKSGEVWLLALLGRSAEAAETLRWARAETSPRDRWALSNLHGHTVGFYLEQEELGTALEETVTAFRKLDISPRVLSLHRRHFYVLHGYARLELLRKDRRSPERRQALRRAIDDLAATWRVPLLTSHLYVLKAGEARLRGDLRGWRRCLERAESLGAEVDSPWVGFEVLREKAYQSEEAGHRNAALFFARLAHSVATQHGWANRARRLRREFPRGWSSHGIVETARTRTESPARLQRHLDALLELSLVSSTVLAPERQARVALDHTIRVLGAERGFLFVLEEGELKLFAARDAGGRNLEPDAVYSRTVVDEVMTTLHPVIGSLENAESAVLHNLRSQMAAPLLVRDRLSGVLYLDNRLARGMFHSDDAEILLALCGHIGVALENSRSAELEVRFEAEQQQRRLAESVRDLNGSLASTLEAGEIAEHLVEALAGQVPSDRASVWLRESDAPLATHPLVDELIAFGGPLAATSERADFSSLPGVQAGDAAWLGVPLATKDELVGLLTLHRVAPFSEHEAELALTFAGQGGVAFEKARLFAEVVRLARHDGLTGVFNRRYFYELAEREFQRAMRLQQPMCAALIDVDHFKLFNDKHGHAVGDQVLRTVAQVCGTALRAFDLLGRYGGEEFVILFPHTDLEGARVVAERLRAAVESTSVDGLSVTVSVGLSELAPGTATLEELLGRADEALYRAKAGGRNCVVAAGGR